MFNSVSKSSIGLSKPPRSQPKTEAQSLGYVLPLEKETAWTTKSASGQGWRRPSPSKCPIHAASFARRNATKQPRLDWRSQTPTPIVVLQAVAMDSLKFHPGPPCPTFLRLVAVFCPFGHATPYAYHHCSLLTFEIALAPSRQFIEKFPKILLYLTSGHHIERKSRRRDICQMADVNRQADCRHEQRDHQCGEGRRRDVISEEKWRLSGKGPRPQEMMLAQTRHSRIDHPLRLTSTKSWGPRLRSPWTLTAEVGLLATSTPVRVSAAPPGQDPSGPAVRVGGTACQRL
jgi:hypothetical protein